MALTLRNYVFPIFETEVRSAKDAHWALIRDIGWTGGSVNCVQTCSARLLYGSFRLLPTISVMKYKGELYTVKYSTSERSCVMYPEMTRHCRNTFLNLENIKFNEKMGLSLN